MPAAAVIPALIAYIKVVAVKKLVVGLWGRACCRALLGRRYRLLSSGDHALLHWRALGRRSFTLKKLECSKQAIA